MAKIKLKVQEDLRTRDGSISKDPLVVNGFNEKTYTYKRPAIQLAIQGSGSSQGTYIYNNNIYVWDTGNPTSPNVYAYTSINRYVVYDNAYDDEYRVVKVSPFGSPNSGQYFTNSGYPLTVGSSIRYTASVVSPPIDTVFDNHTFTYKAYKKASAALTGTSTISAVVPSGWILKNTQALSSPSASYYLQGIYGPTTTLYLSITDPVLTDKLYSMSNVEVDTLTYTGKATTGITSQSMVFDSGKYYSFSDQGIGLWFDDFATTTTWAHEIGTGSILDKYDAANNVIYNDGYVYGFTNYNIVNGLTKFPWASRLAGISPTSVSTTGLPGGSQPVHMWFKDSTYLYCIIDTTPAKIYRSTTGATWSLFYTFSSNIGLQCRLNVSNTNYILFISASTFYCLTVNDTGTTTTLDSTGVTTANVDSFIGMFYNGTSVYGIGQKNLGSNQAIKVYKKP